LLRAACSLMRRKRGKPTAEFGECFEILFADGCGPDHFLVLTSDFGGRCCGLDYVML
jgi:hypothetical protein